MIFQHLGLHYSELTLLTFTQESHCSLTSSRHRFGQWNISSTHPRCCWLLLKTRASVPQQRDGIIIQGVSTWFHRLSFLCQHFLGKLQWSVGQRFSQREDTTLGSEKETSRFQKTNQTGCSQICLVSSTSQIPGSIRRRWGEPGDPCCGGPTRIILLDMVSSRPPWVQNRTSTKTTLPEGWFRARLVLEGTRPRLEFSISRKSLC